eukprot:gnl/Spiro4/15100_TR8135_c0_g2_i1.p1 gnl/Spiro4/15100_TR8135_c0_g2~~gnl/Spiro4/15100_TR8135_c0_g2_i1.p1  ORF type:complete len:324 (+),score=23.56 gnl/Spiro4/15100_TR8135_c0_g2_i1:458-1429(+)
MGNRHCADCRIFCDHTRVCVLGAPGTRRETKPNWSEIFVLGGWRNGSDSGAGVFVDSGPAQQLSRFIRPCDFVGQLDSPAHLHRARVYARRPLCACWLPEQRRHRIPGSTRAMIHTLSGVCGCGVQSLIILPMPPVPRTASTSSCASSSTYRFLVGGGDGTLSLYNWTVAITGAVSPAVLEARTTVDGPAMHSSLQGSTLVAGTRKCHIYVADLARLADGARLWRSAHSDAVTDVSFCRSRTDRVATCSADGHVRLWDMSTYMCVLTTPRVVQTSSIERGPACLCVAYHDDYLVSGWSDGQVRVHSSSSGELCSRWLTCTVGV